MNRIEVVERRHETPIINGDRAALRNGLKRLQEPIIVRELLNGLLRSISEREQNPVSVSAHYDPKVRRECCGALASLTSIEDVKDDSA